MIRLTYREILEKTIAMLDRKIDSLVYQLYGLTDEEIAIVDRIIYNRNQSGQNLKTI